jgi:Tol biopolymer transport system component
MSATKRWTQVLALSLLGLGLALPPAAQATFPGQNGRIFFVGITGGSGFYDIFSANPDGTGIVNLTDLPGGPGEGLDPSVSANGSRVAFTVGSQATSEVWVMNADGSSPQRLTSNTALDQMPGISPDGSRIAFMTTRDTVGMGGLDYDIWIMDADGSDQQLLLNGSGEDYFPEFTPDGQTVVMASEVSGDLDIASVPALGGPFNVATGITTASTLVETTPSVSPDGGRVAFIRTDGALPFDRRNDLLSIGLGGTGELPVAADPTLNERTPTYSPDGTKIVFGLPSGLTIAAAGGSSPAPLALDPAVVTFPGQPDWAVARPDTTAPQTEITKRPPKRTTRTRAKFGFSSNEPGSTFECKFDKGRFAPCSSPRRYRRLAQRGHKFQVRATDPAGNTDPTSARAKFRVTG